MALVNLAADATPRCPRCLVLLRMKREQKGRKPVSDTDNWIRVQIIRSASFRIYCKNCGHDDYETTLAAAVDRGRSMHVDHIPGSPERVLSCYEWSPESAAQMMEAHEAAKWVTIAA